MDDSRLVLEIVGASNVPKADLLSESDPYVVFWVSSRDGEPRGMRWTTLARDDAENVKWHCFREMHCGKMLAGDVLNIELWDEDALKDDKLATASIPLADVDTDPADFELDGTKDKFSGATVTLRRVAVGRAEAIQRIFIVRHGESKWNEAQSSKNLAGMMHFDHGLSRKGMEQARSLNAKWKATVGKADCSEAEQQFLKADCIYASPLTRATQTCLLACQDHPSIQQQGVRLLSTCREIKNLGGLDSVGVATGEGIAARVWAMLGEELGVEAAAAAMDGVELDPYDCATEWWTKDKDTSKRLNARYEDFLHTMRFGRHTTPIVVGHSLFTRELCQRFDGQNVVEKSLPDLLEYKLANGACVSLSFDFNQGDAPTIVAAELMYGSSFHYPSDREASKKAEKPNNENRLCFGRVCF